MKSSTGKNKILLRSSLSRDYIIFATAITITLLLAVMFVAWTIRYTQGSQEERILSSTAAQVDRVITDSFDTANHLAGYLGKQIAAHGAQDLNFIADLFKKASDTFPKEQRLFSWTLFDWIDNKNMLTVSSKHGVMKDPPDMSFRSYTVKAPKNPWTLQVSKPAVGIPSGIWIIPSAVGVADDNGKYLGGLGIGFNITNFSKKIENAITREGVNFIVLDEELNIAMQSSTNSIDPKSDIYKKHFGSMSLLAGKSGYFEDNPVEFNGVLYTHYRKINDYPYVVLTGFTAEFLEHKFYTLLMPRALEFFLLGAFFITLLYYFRKHIISPIESLSSVAQEVSRGNTNIKIKRGKKYSKEFFYLARALLSVVKYVKRENRVKKQLSLAKNELESANQNLKRFMNVLAHDICSPISSALGFAEIMMKDPLEKEKYKEYSEDIYNVTHDVLEMVNELLDSSKIEAGKRELMGEVVCVENVLDETVAMEKSAAERKGIEIIKEYNHENPYHLISERKLLLRICINLLSNAVKYSEADANKKIHLSVNADADHFSIVFKDEGYGISDVNEAVKPYNNMSSPNRNQVRSTGLGLYSVKQMVENLHEGELVIESEPEKGTTVICRFPRSHIVAEHLDPDI